MKKGVFILILATLSLIGTIPVYFCLPDSIPLHWNFSGKIDSWGPKWNIFILGALPLAVGLMMRWLPRIDPRRESYARHARTYEIMQTFIVLVLMALVWVSVLAALGAPVDIGVIVRILIGLLFIGLGNFMGRLKRNYFVGIKTPWTLADDEVWRRTHRCGGWVFVAMGAVFILSLLVPAGPVLGVVTGISTIGGIAYIYLYSWLQWRALYGDKRPSVDPGDRADGKGDKELDSKEAGK